MLPLTNEDDFVARMERILTELAHDRSRLEQLRQTGMAYVRECLTWEAKAQATTRVLNWVAGRGSKPELPPPKMLRTEHSRSSRTEREILVEDSFLGFVSK